MVSSIKRELVYHLKNALNKEISGDVVRTCLPYKNNQLTNQIRTQSLCLNVNNLINEGENGHINSLKEFLIKHISSNCPFVSQIMTDQTNINEPKLVFQIDKKYFFQQLSSAIKRDIDKYAINSCPNAKQTIIVEFSSPNIAKPFHVGNFRSTIIGNFVSNLMSYFGHNVIRLNYLGDWGTQFGILSLAYDYFGDDEKLKTQALRHLLDVYVKGNAECKADEEWMLRAKERFHVLETKQNEDALKQWQHFRVMSVEELKKLYSRLNIAFDEFHSESMYSQASSDVIQELEHLHLTQTDEDGGVFAIVNNPAFKGGRNRIPVWKNDGSSLYLTRDIAAAIHRKERYDFNKMYYVVDQGQSEHFVNLKNILNETGRNWQNDMIHVKFGRIQGMSTRKGDIVFLEDLLDEAKAKAIQSMKSTATTKVNEQDMESVGDILGSSGLIINDFKNRRSHNYKFDWNQALQQHGMSGIALQYVHARMCNLELNCGMDVDLDCVINYEAIDTKEGNELVSIMAMFDDVLRDTFRDLEPNLLVKYLFELKSSINRANKYLTVKGEPQEIAKTRLLLFICAKNVLNQSMKLLGINPLKSM